MVNCDSRQYDEKKIEWLSNKIWQCVVALRNDQPATCTLTGN